MDQSREAILKRLTEHVAFHVYQPAHYPGEDSASADYEARARAYVESAEYEKSVEFAGLALRLTAMERARVIGDGGARARFWRTEEKQRTAAAEKRARAERPFLFEAPSHEDAAGALEKVAGLYKERAARKRGETRALIIASADNAERLAAELFEAMGKAAGARLREFLEDEDEERRAMARALYYGRNGEWEALVRSLSNGQGVPEPQADEE